MTSLPPSSTGFATVSTAPDIRIFYSVTPALPLDPKKPVIVLANSLAATTALWDTFTAEFASTHTIVRYDARFHGQSPLSTTDGFDYEKGHSIDDLADDVVKVLDAVGVASPPTFIGLSIGGGVGVSLAARYPYRFSSFIVVGSRSHAAPGDAARMAERAAFYRSHGARAQAEQRVERWFGKVWPGASEQNRATAKRVADIVVQTPVGGFEASAAALNNMDLRGQAATINSNGDGKRVLFVVGADDGKLVVDESRQLAETAGSPPLKIVANCGHIVNIQQPDEFHAIVKERLAEQE